MNCNEVEASSPLWLSGELEEGQTSALRAHLAGCKECARRMLEQAALDGRIAAAVSERDDHRGAAEIERAVLRRIGAERVRRSVVLLGVAAAGLLAVFAGYESFPARPAPRMLTDAARDHRVEVAEHQPRRWRTEMAEIELLAGRFGLSGEKAASLAPRGYRLLHARTCGLEGRPALHLVFTDGAHEVSVYVRQGGGSGVLRTASVDGEQLATLATAGYETVVVSGGSSADCVQIARRAAALL